MWWNWVADVPDVCEGIRLEPIQTKGSGQESVSHPCCLWQSVRRGWGGRERADWWGGGRPDSSFASASTYTSLLLQGSSGTVHRFQELPETGLLIPQPRFQLLGNQTGISSTNATRHCDPTKSASWPQTNKTKVHQKSQPGCPEYVWGLWLRPEGPHRQHRTKDQSSIPTPTNTPQAWCVFMIYCESMGNSKFCLHCIPSHPNLGH